MEKEKMVTLDQLKMMTEAFKSNFATVTLMNAMTVEVVKFSDIATDEEVQAIIDEAFPSPESGS